MIGGSLHDDENESLPSTPIVSSQTEETTSINLLFLLKSMLYYLD